MYTRVTDFTADYREEAREAQKNWDALTDESLQQRAGEGLMSIAEQLWHVASIWQYVFVTELKLWPEQEFSGEAPPSAAGLAQFYREAAEKATAWIEQNWGDADLASELELWGMRMTRGKLLWELIKHEAHHRGQIVTLMRLAGVPVHGIYGPSKEEVAKLEQAAADETASPNGTG